LSSKELIMRQRREVSQLQREELEVSRLLDKALGLKVILFGFFVDIFLLFLPLFSPFHFFFCVVKFPKLH
jgi:hypothetical protein